MYKEDLALNNQQWLICHKIKVNHLADCKQMCFGSFKNIAYKPFALNPMYKKDLSSNNPDRLICH